MKGTLIGSQHLQVEDPSQVGEARRLVTSLCRDLGFDESLTGTAALIVTELATNLVKHTARAGGDLLFRPIEGSGQTGLDILSLDLGPGIANMSASLGGGYSTTGSSGIGLGAIRRLSSVFDIYSSLGKGTAVFSRLWKNSDRKSTFKVPPPLDVGAVCLPVRGEQMCGDAWAMKLGCDTTLFMLADGLGHGPDAAAASNLAATIFEKQVACNPVELVHLIDVGLRGTRGAAVAVAEIALGTRIVRFAGVGNIAGRILVGGASCCNLVSRNGTAGVEVRKIQEFSYDWPKVGPEGGGLLVLHSDGLDTHWRLEDYPGLALKAPALIAGVLFRDHRRLRDDSTVVVIREAWGETWRDTSQEARREGVE